MPQRILVAVDGSSHAERAVDFASMMAKTFSSQLYLVHAVTDRTLTEDERRLAETEYLRTTEPTRRLEPALVGTDPDFVARKVHGALHAGDAAAREAIGRHLLGEALVRAQEAGAKVADAILADGSPAAVITDTANRVNADHIVMGARGLSNLSGILLGSVSKKVVHDAHCPCTIIR